MLVELTDDNFKNEVTENKEVILVDFWAPWCGPCLILSPVIEEIAKEYQDKIKIGKLNVDKSEKVASEYNIMSIPTLIIFKDGKPVDQMVGITSKETIKTRIDKAILGE